MTCHVAYTVQLCQQRGDIEGVTHGLYVTAAGAGGGLHTLKCGRSHLTAGHTVYTVVYEHNYYVLTTVAGVHGLTCTDGGQVSVTLVGEHKLIGLNALNTCCNGAGTSVSSLNYIELIEIIKEYRAAYR